MTAPSEENGPVLDRAALLCDLGRFEEALSTLAPVLATEPEDAVAHCLAAQAQLGLGQNPAALESAAYAVARAPDEEWPHRLMSIAASSLGDFPTAAAAAREAVRCAPDIAAPYVQLAYALTKLPRGREEAFAAAYRGVELAPDEATTHIALGTVAAAAGRRDEAAQAFEAALAIEPENAVAHNELARLRLRRTNIANPSGLAQAASGFATAVSVDPRSATSRANIEIVLRNFLALTAYFVFVDAYLFQRVSAHSSSSGARLLPIVLLVVPGYFAYKFVTQVPPMLRDHLMRLPWVSRSVRVAALLEVIAVTGIAAAALVPESARPGIAGISAAVALAGRVVLWFERERVAKSMPGYQSVPAIRTSILVALAAMLVLLAVALIAAIPTAGVGAAVAAAFFAFFAGWAIRVIVLRRRARF